LLENGQSRPLEDQLCVRGSGSSELEAEIGGVHSFDFV
jgi:hypothetical protein